jgi:hypothetical protein
MSGLRAWKIPRPCFDVGSVARVRAKAARSVPKTTARLPARHSASHPGRSTTTIGPQAGLSSANRCAVTSAGSTTVHTVSVTSNEP